MVRRFNGGLMWRKKCLLMLKLLRINFRKNGFVSFVIRVIFVGLMERGIVELFMMFFMMRVNFWLYIYLNYLKVG